jgi:hypothetical protein
VLYPVWTFGSDCPRLLELMQPCDSESNHLATGFNGFSVSLSLVLFLFLWCSRLPFTIRKMSLWQCILEICNMCLISHGAHSSVLALSITGVFEKELFNDFGNLKIMRSLVRWTWTFWTLRVECYGLEIKCSYKRLMYGIVVPELTIFW